MLQNVHAADSLRGLARARASNYETKTVRRRFVEAHRKMGWTVDKKNEKSVRLRRRKVHNVRLEDRVWSLLYRMGFTYLSGKSGASLLLNPKEPNGPKSQIDVVAIDDDVAFAIECKSAERRGKRPQFQEELGKHALIRGGFSSAMNSQYALDHKRAVVLAMFQHNIILSDNDKDRARQANVVLFDEQDLSYYENLASQVGPAAKYQFFSDALPNKEVQGLRIRVPAIRAKMGGFNCYGFCISPEYLLKVSFVSHRVKGKGSDVNTYQRMLKKSRLKEIKEYITKDGIFPTNIVINADKKHLRFERIRQKADPYVDSRSGMLGWLEIRPTYKSAWIIDGQHRLYAYSGHKRAPNSLLSVLAFEGLPASKQAELFIDINNKQKTVKRSLLEELYAELHWDAADPRIRVKAIVSKAIQELNTDPESPFHQRIQEADDTKSPTRCITLASLYGAIEKKGFHIVKEKHDQVVEYGPLWEGDRALTLKRTTYTLKNWFNLIRYGAEDWWDKGSGEGGGLAMNDAVIACIDVLRSLFYHLDASGQKLVDMDNEELFECVRKYGEALAGYLGSLSENDRMYFRSLRGVQGQTTRTRLCQKAIRLQCPDFSPPGLDEFLNLEKAGTNKKAKEVLDRMEVTLQKLIIDQLRYAFGPDETQWWVKGVPKAVRIKARERQEEDDRRRGGMEYYLDLIDYRRIAVTNWGLFEPLLAYGKSGNKDARTAWLDFVNEQRNLVAHPSSGASVSFDDLGRLQEYDEWLSGQSKKDLSKSSGEVLPSQNSDTF